MKTKDKIISFCLGVSVFYIIFGKLSLLSAIFAFAFMKGTEKVKDKKAEA